MNISFYTVNSGDQLLKILYSHYGKIEISKNREIIIANIRLNNPHIKNIDFIYPGQVIMLPGVGAERSCRSTVVNAAAQISTELAGKTPESRAILSSIDTERALEFFNNGSGGFVDLVHDALIKTKPHFAKVALEYYRSKSGTTTRGRYDYQRRVSIRRAERDLGVLRKLVYPRRRLNEVIRIKPHAALRTQAILSEMKRIDRIVKLAKVAKGGGILLNCFQVADATLKYQDAETREERTAIVVETAGGIAGSTVGTMAGVAVASLLLATPVGWVGIAIAIGGGIAGSQVGERAAEAISQGLLHDEHGKRVDCWAERQWKALF